MASVYNTEPYTAKCDQHFGVSFLFSNSIASQGFGFENKAQKFFRSDKFMGIFELETC